MGNRQDRVAFAVNFISNFKISLQNLFIICSIIPSQNENFCKHWNRPIYLEFFKKGKCPESCASYRPIALLNVDRKLLSVLASHLENLLPVLIKDDQTGFIKGRNSSANIRRLLNAIQAFKQNSIIAFSRCRESVRPNWMVLFILCPRQSCS